ncbi:BgTH12-02004 [Blumeria graminis f. sp. triticale]|uniref:Bgt-51500 n=2 Tax=Blumeria graminis TaxID=34373 RepID=A0A9X9QCA6_BLUGR|nr:BgTH12-02004 [Blumeria graminis f. sp. triticale]VDB84403.1 Bgt-51500 [Blumeria graminis f. sp. tritici]
MHLTFLFFILIVRYFHQVFATNVPFLDMNIPDGTTGFICDIHYFKISYLWSSAQGALTKFLRRSPYHQFPAFFEDAHAFGIADQLLLSWPLVISNKVYTTGVVGTYRVVINAFGQIIGVIAITQLNDVLQKPSFRKCAPVHVSDEQDQNNSISEDLIWDYVYPTKGYICDLKFLEISQVNYAQEMIVDPEFQRELRNTGYHKYVENYNGKLFTGSELQAFKIQKLDKYGKLNGKPGSFRMIFNLDQGFMGIIHVTDSERKCVKVWDLTESPHMTDNSSNSHVFDGKVPEKYTPYYCLRQVYKFEYIKLQANFFTSQLHTVSGKDEDMYPIVLGQNLILWPLRLPESNYRLNYNLAIGLNQSGGTFNIYYSRARGDFKIPEPCGIDFTI